MHLLGSPASCQTSSSLLCAHLLGQSTSQTRQDAGLELAVHLFPFLQTWTFASLSRQCSEIKRSQKPSNRRRSRLKVPWVCQFSTSTSRPLLTSTGKISLKLPLYMSIDHDQASRKIALNVLNRKERNQREMWGRWTPAAKMGFC